MDLRQRAAFGLRAASFASLAAAGLQLAQLAVLARLLTPADFGLIAAIAIGLGLATLLYDAGLSSALIHRQSASREELSSLYWIQVGLGLALFALAWLTVPSIAALANEPRLTPLLRAAALTLAVAPLGRQFESLLQRDLRFELLSWLLTAAQVSGALCAVALALAGAGVWAFVLGQLALNAVYTLGLLAVGLRRYRPLWRCRRSDLAGFVGFGLYQLGERGLNFISERLDQVAVGALLGQEALGTYNFASSLALQLPMRVNPVVARVAMPVLARLQDDPGRLQRGYLKLLRFLMAVNGPLLLGLAAVAPLAVPKIFGEVWRPAVPLVQVLTLVALQRAIGFPTGSLLLTRGRADWSFRWSLALLLVSLPLVVVAAHASGEVLAVAWSLAGLQLAMRLPSYALLVRPLIGPCGRAYLRAILGPCALAAVMAAAVAGLDFLSAQCGVCGDRRGLFALGVEVGFGALLYLGLLLLFERPLLREAIASFRKAPPPTGRESPSSGPADDGGARPSAGEPRAPEGA